MEQNTIVCIICIAVIIIIIAGLILYTWIPKNACPESKKIILVIRYMKYLADSNATFVRTFSIESSHGSPGSETTKEKLLEIHMKGMEMLGLTRSETDRVKILIGYKLDTIQSFRERFDLNDALDRDEECNERIANILTKDHRRKDRLLEILNDMGKCAIMQMFYLCKDEYDESMKEYDLYKAHSSEMLTWMVEEITLRNEGETTKFDTIGELVNTYGVDIKEIEKL